MLTPLLGLREAIARDDWDACEVWGAAHLEDPRLSNAAASVLGALERDRPRRDEQRAAGLRTALMETQRCHFSGISRVWELGLRAGSVREAGEPQDSGYGVVVVPHEGVPVALAVAATRACVVAAEAPEGTRAERQLMMILHALAYATHDGAGVGRGFELAPGRVCHVDLRSGAAPLWPSRYRVERGEVMAAWLEADDVVSVYPSGGRLALAPFVVQLEQAVKNLRRKVWLARSTSIEASLDARAIDGVLDKLELLEAWGWTRELEPLRPQTEQVLAQLAANAAPADLARAIAAHLGDAPPE